MNPELRRNLWLELTLHRMLAMPAGLALAFMLAYALNESDPRPAIAIIAATLFAAFALWGGVHVGDAVMGEARARTWDGQRMSALEPWAMTWGKLIGAPAFAWCGGAICLVVYLGASPEPHALKVAVLMIAAAVLLHAIALIGSVVAARKAVVRSSSSAWVLGLALIFVGPWISVLSTGDNDIAWWGEGRARVDFMLGSTAVFAAWAVFGAHRLMCQELRVRTLAWAWLGFLVFVSVYIAGFGIRPQDSFGQRRNVVLIAGLIVSLAAAYPLLVSESSGAVAVRRMLVRFGARDWRRLLEETPLWPVTLGLALVFCVLTVLFVGPRSGGDEMFRPFALAPLALFFLAVRDASIFMFFALARQPRRAEAAAIFYLALLYWLVPLLLRTAGAKGLADLVLPPFWDQPGFATMIAAVHAAAGVAAALWRWRVNYGRK